jgi:hypothetical protein
MNKEEFDQYLKSIGGLKSAYKRDLIIDNSGFFEFGQGWYQITKNLIEDLIALGWDKIIAQAKEKFGTGRFYIGAANDEVWERIHKWEDEETASTCERCGSTDNVELRGNLWVTTLCNNCSNKRDE